MKRSCTKLSLVRTDGKPHWNWEDFPWSISAWHLEPDGQLKLSGNGRETIVPAEELEYFRHIDDGENTGYLLKLRDRRIRFQMSFECGKALESALRLARLSPPERAAKRWWSSPKREVARTGEAYHPIVEEPILEEPASADAKWEAWGSHSSATS